MMVVTLTRDGYVKRTPLETFRAQNRGGRGRSAAATRQDDVVVRSFIAHTHQWVLFFTSRGMAFREKIWQLPEGGAQGKGRSLRQVLQLQDGEQVDLILWTVGDCRASSPDILVRVRRASLLERREHALDGVRHHGEHTVPDGHVRNRPLIDPCRA